MKNENDIESGVRVKWKGDKYVTGNRRHKLVELYDGQTFVRSVKISNIKKA